MEEHTANLHALLALVDTWRRESDSEKKHALATNMASTAVKNKIISVLTGKLDEIQAELKNKLEKDEVQLQALEAGVNKFVEELSACTDEEAAAKLRKQLEGAEVQVEMGKKQIKSLGKAFVKFESEMKAVGDMVKQQKDAEGQPEQQATPGQDHNYSTLLTVSLCKRASSLNPSQPSFV